MPTYFARSYIGADSKAPLEKTKLLIRDFTVTVLNNALYIGGFDVQPQELDTTDTYALVGQVDLATIYIKNKTPGSDGTLVVTGVLI